MTLRSPAPRLRRSARAATRPRRRRWPAPRLSAGAAQGRLRLRRPDRRLRLELPRTTSGRKEVEAAFGDKVTDDLRRERAPRARTPSG